MTLQKLMEGIYADTDGTNGGNHGAIVLDDEVVMVDAGIIHTKSQIANKILREETGLPILKLILTHCHSDHVFGVQAFEPVSLIASELTRNGCEENLRHNWKIDVLKENYATVKDERPELWNSLQSLFIRLPDIVFTDKISIGNKSEITVKHFGGHTAGSSVVVSHQYNTIFIGDLIFNGSFPYGGDQTCDPDRWITALEEIIGMRFETVIPGHGSVCGRDEVEEYATALKELRTNVKDAIDSEISIETFIESNKIPQSLSSGVDRFAERTLQHWYKFYA
ncbi:MAG: MBL fold metallo-hydrolase [Promethearchaeota archaeon]